MRDPGNEVARREANKERDSLGTSLCGQNCKICDTKGQQPTVTRECWQSPPEAALFWSAPRIVTSGKSLGASQSRAQSSLAPRSAVRTLGSRLGASGTSRHFAQS